MAANSLDILLLRYRQDTSGAASPQYRDTKVTKGICNACKRQIKALLYPSESVASFQQNNTKFELKQTVRGSKGEQSLLVNY